METKVENLDDNRVKVTVTIDQQTIEDGLKKQYREIAQRYTIPGFRKGKAPRPVIDSALGKDYVRATYTDELVNDVYPRAIDACDIYPVGQPEFGEEDMALVEDGKPYTFVFEVSVKPTLELSSYDPVSIELPSEKVTDKQVDEEIDRMREHYAEVVPAPASTKIKEDGSVEIKIKATDDAGADISSISDDKLAYTLGSGIFPPSFDEQLEGMKKGDTKQFTIDMPKESYAKTAPLAGHTSKINFDVEVLAVNKKKLPELTDEWVKSKIGLENVKELQDEVREDIQTQVDSILPRLKEARVLAALQERLSEEPSDAVIEEEEASLLQDFFTQLQSQGITLDVYLKQQGITQEQFRDDVKMQARDVAKQDMALDAWAAKKGMEATDQDIHDEFVKAGAADPDALIQEWIESGRMHLIRQGILRQKAAADVMDTAVVEPGEEKDKKKSTSTKKKASAKDSSSEEKKDTKKETKKTTKKDTKKE